MSSKLTPREPTMQMLDAGYLTLDVSKGIYLTLNEVWQIMHDAAPGGPYKTSEMREEIEALRAEVKTLTLERDRAQDREREYLTQLAAEREKGERLREALADIAGTDWADNALDPQRPARIARDAIKGDTNDQ